MFVGSHDTDTGKEDMKKLAKTRLVLDRDTIQILTRELARVAGGRPPCTGNETGCTHEPPLATSPC